MGPARTAGRGYAAKMLIEAQRRVGIHLGTAGGVFKAAERAHEIGANTFQIFSASPRMWRAAPVPPAASAKMKELRALYGCSPLVIHTSYLVNVCSQSDEVRANSIRAFRGEVERALDLAAEYLVLHPGSWRGLTREQGLLLATESIERALDGIPWPSRDFTILIENTAGAEFSLGGSLEQVAELVGRLRPVAPVAACLDTCHLHVAGYDIVTPEGHEATVGQIEKSARAQDRSGVAHERRQGGARFSSRPARAHWRRSPRPRPLPPPAERSAFCPLGLHCGDSRR